MNLLLSLFMFLAGSVPRYLGKTPTYRTGLLMYGKDPTLGEQLQWRCRAN